MRSLIRKPPTPLRAIIAAFVLMTLVFASFAISRIAAAASATPTPQDGRLVTIYDRGTTKVILTHATTVGEAISDAGIRLDPKDAVEPATAETIPVNDYKIYIYRARTVIVVDGTIREKVMTPYQTPEQIAKSAGITLYDEDKTTVSLTNDDNIISEGAGLVMTIQRATPITFVQYGTTITVRTQAKTVADMLKEKHIVLAKDDTLSVPTSTAIQPGMTVELWREGVQTLTQNEDIPFDTQQVQNADQSVGYTQIQTPGVLGKRTVSYQVDMKNGQEVSRTMIQSVTTSEPKSQVEIVGTKVNLPPGSHQDWMAAAGISSNDYGYVEYIVNREGGWTPCKVQGGTIDCFYGGYMGYGVVQATPGSKMGTAGADWRTNPITQLRWATNYAVGRYGSWSGAYYYWVSHHNW